MKKIYLFIALIALVISCTKPGHQSEGVKSSETVSTSDLITIKNDSASKIFTAEDLFKTKRVGEMEVSPDGKWILYKMSTPNIEENKLFHDLFVCGIDGQNVQQLTNDPAHEFNAKWSPDGTKIAYLSTKDGAPQIYVQAFPKGAAKKITSIENGIGGFKWSPDGTQFLFTSDVKIEKNLVDKYPAYTKANMRIYDKLLIRHWDEWEDENYSHLFTIPANGGEAKDLMPGEAFDTPMKPFGGMEELAWSPDGTEIAYSCKKVDNYAFTTNSDIYIVNLADGKTRNITEKNKGYDKVPAYSPDGQWIAYNSMEHDGFESDKNRLMLLNRKTNEVKDLTANLDQWCEEFIWSPDSKSVYFVANDSGTVQLYNVDLNGKWKMITNGAYTYGHGLGITPDGQTVITGRQSFIEPMDIVSVNVNDGKTVKVTDLNKDLYAQFVMPSYKEQYFTSTDGKKFQSWLIFPPNFDPNKKYPMITYCQGGPQSQINPNFHFRWNMMLMASHGYIVMASNRRGVPGFGQEWNNAISKDWGGMPMQDFLAATDVMKAQSYVDKDGLAALGASAGGYATFWLAGNHQKRFKAFIAHCGVFDFTSMYGSTEEMFFSNWEYGGPYWDPQHAPNYEKNSPHKFVQNWDTPIMISTGERDFRVPYTQSLEAFTAAQAKGIPSKLIVMPNETHFISRPQEFLIWSNEFFGWLDKYCKK